jgi:hypothetical protein
MKKAQEIIKIIQNTLFKNTGFFNSGIKEFKEKQSLEQDNLGKLEKEPTNYKKPKKDINALFSELASMDQKVFKDTVEILNKSNINIVDKVAENAISSQEILKMQKESLKGQKGK